MIDAFCASGVPGSALYFGFSSPAVPILMQINWA
jgi:hypothetical protein